MTMLQKTLFSTFKGVPFLVTSASTNGGKKTAKQTFPNSDNQVIEKLGKMQKTYTIEGFIQNNTTTDDYNQKKSALISALESNENGVLVHPWFGVVENMINTVYSVAETFGELGIARFNMTFEVDLVQSVPTIAANTFSQVKTAAKAASDSINATVAETYVTDFFNNVSSSIGQIEGFVDEAQKKIRIFSVVSQELNELSTEISDIATDVVELINTPAQLADSLQGVFDTMTGAYASVNAAFDVMSDFWGFGDLDINWSPDTQSKKERQTNQDVFNSAINSFTLTQSYELASQIQFVTVREQQELATALEEQYDKVVNSPGISAESVGLITDLRIAVEKLFDAERINLGRIIEIQTVATSARLLSYQYYGQSLLGESIANLNNLTDASSILFGKLDIITS